MNSRIVWCGLFLAIVQPVYATNHFVRINEVMAGLNGDSSIQFLEMVAQGSGQKDWGPQGGEIVGRAMLTFHDAVGNQTGRFVVPNSPGGTADTVLFATQAFADLTGITPDFIFPVGVMPIVGKVCFRNNPDNGGAFPINLCLSYGGGAFTGATEETSGGANPADLSILGSQSLSRNDSFSFGPGSQNNTHFVLATPTPNSTSNSVAGVDTNTVGEVVLPVAASQLVQGENLFTKEGFLGNGRTCATCHLEADNFGLTPARLASFPATDSLFINEINVNTLTVDSAGSINPVAASGFAQPSDFFLHDTITGTLGGAATVLAGSGDTYLVLGGESLDILDNVITDSAGNTGTLVLFTAGNLNGPTPTNSDPIGIEDTTLLTGGRALIVENINGFTEFSFRRTSLNLQNVKHTAPYGLSGEFADLQTFSAGAVPQHFTRSLNRVAGTDFREPTADELDAMAAFQDTLFLPADEDFDEANNFDKFVTTPAQVRGRDLFFGAAKCSVCHDGNVLAVSDGQFGTTVGVNEAFNTGVADLPINAADGLPTEQDLLMSANSRTFSTRPLFGLKNTAPFFHDNSVSTLLEAIQFYDTIQFRTSPAFAQVGAIDAVGILANAQDIQAFLEGLFGCSTTINALDFTDAGAVTDVDTERACDSITAGGGGAGFTIAAGGSRIFQASEIFLTPGFKVDAGGKFVAEGRVP